MIDRENKSEVILRNKMEKGLNEEVGEIKLTET